MCTDKYRIGGFALTDMHLDNYAVLIRGQRFLLFLTFAWAELKSDKLIVASTNQFALFAPLNFKLKLKSLGNYNAHTK